MRNEESVLRSAYANRVTTVPPGALAELTIDITYPMRTLALILMYVFRLREPIHDN